MQKPLLSVRHLSKTFTQHILGGKRVAALQDVSFDIEPGQCVAFIGGSGAGKSTLLKCIHRTCLPTSGSMEFRSASGSLVDLATADDRRVLELRREEIRYVPQFLRAAPRVPAVDVVAMPHVVNGNNLDSVRQEASAMLTSLGIRPELQTSYPAVFSGGEQQRVNVARALLRARRFILLDEPTSALDAENRAKVLDLLTKARAGGSSIIAIMHDLPTLERLADQVLVLRDGEVLAMGAPAEIDVAEYVGGRE